jgi:hypothetical protein
MVKNKNDFKIYGDSHSKDDLNKILKIVKKEKPDYFLCEFLLEDRVMDKKQAKKRLDAKGKGKLCDPEFNISYYILAYETNIPVIGIDLDSDLGTLYKKDYYKNRDIKESFKRREKRMVEVIKEFKDKGKIIVFVGDTHLRTIKTDQLGPISPLQKEFSKEAIIIRSKNGEIK